MNIRLLTIEAANNRWEPAFIGSDFFPILRKLIVVSDLTICLDKRNAAGKIDVYQEPILYRSLLTIHMLKSYNSVNAKWAATTRFDIHCDRFVLIKKNILFYKIKNVSLRNLQSSHFCQFLHVNGKSFVLFYCLNLVLVWNLA